MERCVYSAGQASLPPPRPQPAPAPAPGAAIHPSSRKRASPPRVRGRPSPARVPDFRRRTEIHCTRPHPSTRTYLNLSQRVAIFLHF
jgi:hypothetical protein